MERYSKGEIAAIILGTIAISGLVFLFAAAPGYAYIFKLFKADSNKDRRKIQRSVAKLQANKFVRVVKTKHGKALALTPKGRKELLRYQIKDLAINKPKQWDGLWRVVVFDIPEEERDARDALRRKLNQLGFYKLQKSTFTYPHECREEIDFIGEYFGVRNCIRYFVAKDIDMDEDALTFFKMSRRKISARK